ncbi:hypothetical protein [Pseudoroseicyclus sp. CXY001]|uniref:hypothetical protein n=1 Tax=Pseudoroseicyclus sp. CXY001 TaxID=3242492 RepID=UPI0035712B69
MSLRRRPRLALLAPAVLLALAGCAGGGGPLGGAGGAAIPSGPPLPEVDTCNAGAHAGLIGQDRRALERVLILSPVQVLDPGDRPSADVIPARIDFHIEPAVEGPGRIARISCG